ncbi:hypothetical protein D3C86_1374130 [compost metagenome]
MIAQFPVFSSTATVQEQIPVFPDERYLVFRTESVIADKRPVINGKLGRINRIGTEIERLNSGSFGKFQERAVIQFGEIGIAKNEWNFIFIKRVRFYRIWHPAKLVKSSCFKKIKDPVPLLFCTGTKYTDCS